MRDRSAVGVDPLRGVVVEHALERALEHLEPERELRRRAGRLHELLHRRSSCTQWWCGFGCSSPTHTARALASRAQNAASSTCRPVRPSSDRVRQRRVLDPALRHRGRGLPVGRAARPCRPADTGRRSRARGRRARQRAGAGHAANATPGSRSRGPCRTSPQTSRASAACCARTDDDFVVDEEPAYLPLGCGRSRLRADREARAHHAAGGARDRRARSASRDRDIGVAGMKDRHAVTRAVAQPAAAGDARGRARRRPPSSVRVLEAARHPHKLRTGHVRAQPVRLRVRGVAGDPAEPRPARGRSSTGSPQPPGAPNWYGEQRFGRDGDNAARGRELVSADAPPGRDRQLDRLFVSALQSELFNAWLVARLADGLYRRVLAGDVLHKRGGGMFDCEDPATDERAPARRRARASPARCSATACGAPPTARPAAAREAAILDAAGLAARRVRGGARDRRGHAARRRRSRSPISRSAPSPRTAPRTMGPSRSRSRCPAAPTRPP